MSNRCRIVFEPMGIVLQAEAGKSIFAIASENNLPIRSDCGGKGLCGKCRVAVNRPENLSEITSSEKRFLKEEQIAEGCRLACQARIQGPVDVTIPGYALDSREADYKTGISGSFTRDPMIVRLLLPQKSKPDYGDEAAMDLAGRVAQRLKTELGEVANFGEVHALRSVSRPFAHGKDITLVHHRERGITAVLPGIRKRSLGAAVDIGTTTLAVYLCDLAAGTLLTSAAAANPQRRYGEDVISRISYANENKSGMEMLGKAVAGGIDLLIAQCLQKVEAEKTDVDEVVIVGNTTMQQAFAGIHLNGIGFSPYLPAARILPDMTAADLRLELNPGTNVHFFPVISGFVGGDTMGVIIAESPHTSEEVALIVDIGTNGEIVLGNRKGLWVASCATGPALEGAQIACGMRAAPGAVHRLDIEPGACTVRYETLGDPATDPPRGLCGSAVIDAAAAMLRAGILLPNGRLKEGRPGVSSDEKGIGRKFTLVPAEKTGGSEICITLGDIRQIQLAKAALFTGVKLLMRAAGVSRVDRLVLTGAFGARFDWRNAAAIGMLPSSNLFSRVEVVENAAGIGAIRALLDRRQRREAEALLPSIRCLELAAEKDFPLEFAGALTFPAP